MAQMKAPPKGKWSSNVPPPSNRKQPGLAAPVVKKGVGGCKGKK